MSEKLLFTSNDWTLASIQKAWDKIDDLGKTWLKVEYNEPQLELITADQMLTVYANNGLPFYYSHWSFGKRYLGNKVNYQKGRQGLAYEVVINTDPAIVYLMETNTMTMMALTLAHAGVGHSAVNKMNYMFKEWTSPDFILDYLKFSRQYIQSCEDRYGKDEVEFVLDIAHMFQHDSIDYYKRPAKSKQITIDEKMQERLQNLQQLEQPTWKSNPAYSKYVDDLKQSYFEEGARAGHYDKTKSWRGYPEENVLYFIEKTSQKLEPWKKEILRIVRKISQYFYPQRMVHMMHEGYASFVHYEIMTKLFKDGYLDDGQYLEFLHSHTAVCNHPTEQVHLGDINPYKLGYSIFKDIKRICKEPTDEDKGWFPEIVGQDWKDVTRDIVKNYRDDSFILQYLSPKVIRDLKLFSLHSWKDNMASPFLSLGPTYEVEEIHDEDGVWNLRQTLADQYSFGLARKPKLEIESVDEYNRLVVNLRTAPQGVVDKNAANKISPYLKELWPDGVVVKNVIKNTSLIRL